MRHYARNIFWLGLALVALALDSGPAQAQFFNRSAVGGVSIDADGVVDAPTEDQQAELSRLREQLDLKAPAEFATYTDLRAVSLKRLQAEIAEHRANGTPLPESVRFLAGLQRVKHVFVYPEENDIVLAGPAEGWKVDEFGTVVGATTNRPVLLLDDLVVALQTREASRMEPISCSIDLTPEGVKRFEARRSRIVRNSDRREAIYQIEESLGPSVVSVTGVPATTHFARTLVAADFRMKRLGMKFEPAPVGGMPSYLDMIAESRGGVESMTPRWWLDTHYEPLARDTEGLSWEIRGQGVKCLTETDHFTAEGERIETGKASPLAQKWADNFTKNFEELANHDSAFGQLRNVIDLAVVAALLEKNSLVSLAGMNLDVLLAEEPAEFNIPRTVATKATFVKRGRDIIVSASGGVQALPWLVADNIEESATAADGREKGKPAGDNWWWQ